MPRRGRHRQSRSRGSLDAEAARQTCPARLGVPQALGVDLFLARLGRRVSRDSVRILACNDSRARLQVESGYGRAGPPRTRLASSRGRCPITVAVELRPRIAHQLQRSRLCWKRPRSWLRQATCPARDPKFRQLAPARRLAATGRPSATSGVIAIGTLRPYHIWCNWLRWPSASYTELVTQVVAGQVLEHVHRLALLVPVAEVDRADCFCKLDRRGV